MPLPIAALIWEARGVARALRERDERLRLSLEAGGLGTWEWMLPTGRIVWSPSLEAIHGLVPGTFGGTFDAFERAVREEVVIHTAESVRLDVEPARRARAARLFFARGTLESAHP